MKKLLFLLIAANGAISTMAQQPSSPKYTQDKDLSRWVLDINFLGGGYNQSMTVANTYPDYLNGININTGTVGQKNGGAVGVDGQIGFFFGKNRHWGIGTGLLYMREWANVTLDNFHAEYQSVDGNGYTFRQVVTANSINERIKTDNFNIPLVLKYKNRFSKHWGFAADAGVLFNLKMKNNYLTNASFDYEAIYKFTNNGDGTSTPVYETATTPASNDFLITKAQFIKNNDAGSVQDYFNTKKGQGYNVGLGVQPNNQRGSVKYATGSVGILVQPSVNYFFSDHVALNLGVYYLYQPFANSGNTNYMLTNKTGDYNSVMNTATKIQTQSYGANIGLRFFLGKRPAEMHITSTDQYAPSQCGMCDGNIALHGLTPGKSATVNYTVNGAKEANSYSSVVNADGTVKLTGLCSGSYTGITAKIGKKSATTTDVTLVDPPFAISSEHSQDPSAKGLYDASITLYGLNAGQVVTVNYTLNGAPQTAFTTTVALGGTVKIAGLGDGTYSNIVVTAGKCTATLGNPAVVVLTSPAPIPVVIAAPAPEPVVEKTEYLSPVLFNFNKSDVRSSSYSVIDQAIDELKDNKNSSITIVGNTDAIGSDEYNQKLAERRAASVKTYLKKKGINPNRIKIKSNGKRDPIATNKTEEGRSENRNAQMHIEKK